MALSGKPVVLHYTGYAADGGGVFAVLRALAGAGRFRCLLGVDPAFVQRGRPRLPVWRGPAIRGDRIDGRTAARALAVAWRVRRWLRRGPRRVCHMHSRAGLLVALWLALLGERRVVVTVHVFGRQRWFYRWAAARLGDRLHWLGPAMKRHYRIGTEDWSRCLPDCVPDAAMQPARRGPVHAPVTFGCAGALVPVKRWDLVVEALASVPRDLRLRVVHVGADDGSAASRAYAENLQRRTRELGIADHMEWRGPADDMAAFFREIDCLIVASPWEASSVAALEAMAAGVPVLAADGSGTRDLIERCHGGWPFPARSAAALGGRMAALVRGTELAEWRRDEAALAGFTASRSAADHLAVYETLLAR